jgi:hypothetical protein
MTAGMKILAWRARAVVVAAAVTLAMGVICGVALVVGAIVAVPMSLKRG